MGEALPPAEQPSTLSVHFNHREQVRYRSPVSGEWRNGDNLEALLIEAIDSAEEKVLVAVQELTRPPIARALIAAHQRNVDVRLILENNYSTPWSRQLPSHLTERQRQRWRRFGLQERCCQDEVVAGAPPAALEGVDGCQWRQLR